MADLHTHPLIPMYYFRKNLNKRHPTAPFLPFHPYGTHLDLLKIKQSGVKLWVSCVYAWNRFPKSSCFEVARDQIALFEDWMTQNSDSFVHVKNGREADEAIQTGKIAVILALEGGHHLSDDLETLSYFKQKGVFYITIVHFMNTRVAASCHAEEFTHEDGLRPFGEKLVEAMEQNNVFVDVAHCSEKAFWNVVEKSRSPLLYTHGGAKPQCQASRNLTDEQTKAIAKSGGLLGTIFFPVFLNERRFRADTTDVLRHLDHWLTLVGPEALAIGTDMNGAMMIHDVPDYAHLPYFQEILVKHFGESIARKILFENVLSFLTKYWR